MIGGTALAVAAGLPLAGSSAVAAPGAVTSQLNNHTLIGVGDWDRNGSKDVVMRNKFTNNLMLYPGNGRLAPLDTAPVTLSYSNWSGWDFMGLADVTGDGRLDVLAEDTLGRLYSFAGNGLRAPAALPGNDIATGWQNFKLAGVANWDRDPNDYPDLVARDGNGTLWVYRGERSRRYSDSRR